MQRWSKATAQSLASDTVPLIDCDQSTPLIHFCLFARGEQQLCRDQSESTLYFLKLSQDMIQPTTYCSANLVGSAFSSRQVNIYCARQYRVALYLCTSDKPHNRTNLNAGCLGITLSYHRQLSHKSFQCPKWLEYVFAYCGVLAVQVMWLAKPIPQILYIALHRYSRCNNIYVTAACRDNQELLIILALISKQLLQTLCRYHHCVSSCLLAFCLLHTRCYFCNISIWQRFISIVYTSHCANSRFMHKCKKYKALLISSEKTLMCRVTQSSGLAVIDITICTVTLQWTLTHHMRASGGVMLVGSSTMRSVISVRSTTSDHSFIDQYDYNQQI